MRIEQYFSSLCYEAVSENLGHMTEDEFILAARSAAADQPHVLLLSGGDHDCSSTSLALLRPAMVLRYKNGSAVLQLAQEEIEEAADPFSVLSSAHACLKSSANPDLRVSIGGYLSYDAGRAIEQLPCTVKDTLQLPDLYFLWPTAILSRDHDSGMVTSLHISWQCDGNTLSAISLPAEPASAKAKHSLIGSTAVPKRSFLRSEYEQTVSRVRSLIYEGDVYQVNLSQRFSFPLPGDPFSLWIALFRENPAPFYAWVEAGTHQILSTSMERLFCIDGSHIESRPIKGTRPRGNTPVEDAELEAELRKSTKDDAELSMIVDLVRNDLGRVCRTGTVHIKEHKRLERYENVQHLVSVVQGILREDADIATVFRAVFPGGSITGCPKIRAMEIIDMLEAEARHAYTGSIGYLSSDGSADFNIAIRTAVVKNNVCHLSVGGGIVYDSDPAEEYIETLHKGDTFFRLAGIQPDLSN